MTKSKQPQEKQSTAEMQDDEVMVLFESTANPPTEAGGWTLARGEEGKNKDSSWVSITKHKEVDLHQKTNTYLTYIHPSLS